MVVHMMIFMLGLQIIHLNVNKLISYEKYNLFRRT